MKQIQEKINQVVWSDLRAVIFDVGGVMLRTENHAPRHAWDARLGLPQGAVEQVVFNSELGSNAQLGRVTTEEHWVNVQNQFGLTEVEREQLRQDFWAGDVLDRDFLGWIESLKGRYRLAIISNAFDDLRRVLIDEFEVGEIFELIVVSAEEGIMKPDPSIYLRTLKRLGVQPAQAVFIDDNLANVTAALNLGIGGILFTPDLDLPALWSTQEPESGIGG